METSALFSVLIVGVWLVLKCEFSVSHALPEADSPSNVATLFDLFIEELYELQYQNKMMEEKIEILDGKLESSESPLENPTTGICKHLSCICFEKNCKSTALSLNSTLGIATF